MFDDLNNDFKESVSDKNGLFLPKEESASPFETSEESKIEFFHPLETNSEIQSVSENFTVPQKSINETNLNVTKKTPKRASISTIILTAAVSGTSIVGVVAITMVKDIDVQLYYKSAQSLVFKVEKRNIDEEDYLYSILMYEDEPYYELEISDEKYITFDGLMEETNYVLQIYIIENYFAEPDENDESQNRDNEPKLLHSASYKTNSYYDERSIEIMNYSIDDGLSFIAINSNNYSFLTTRVFSDEKEILTDDFSGVYKEYHIDFDSSFEGKSIYISLKYKDNGVGFLYLEPLYIDG